MNKKHGFTLIELLAVIVVLAIIALIATPIVMNTIKRSKKGAAERSADSYVKQVEVAVATERLNKNEVLDGEYQITSDGNLCRDKSASCSDDEKIKIEMNGTKPTSGKIKITNGTVDQASSNMTIGDYTVSYNSAKKTYEAPEKNNSTKAYTIKVNLTNVTGDSGNVTSITSKDIKSLKFTANSGYELPDSVTVSGATYTWDETTGTLTLSKVTGDVNVTVEGAKVSTAKTYSNGEVVYFNVTTGKKCSDYTEAQSNTGVKSGCMKFYVFNYDGGSNVNLLLDHNTTATVKWSSSESSVAGPKEVLDQLKEDTKSWVGTITPENYSIDQSTQKSKAKYTVDYSSYKARLITAQEVAQITGNTTFDERTSTLDLFYFDTNTSTASITCKKGDTSGCSYGWLYDRTNESCTTNGCLNNSDQEGAGYWTSTPLASYSNYAWNIVCIGNLIGNRIVGSPFLAGVRPVITVAKSNLS